MKAFDEGAYQRQMNLMNASPIFMHRRRLIGISLGAVVGTLGSAKQLLSQTPSGWRASLQKYAAWLEQKEGVWHCGSGNLPELTTAIMRELKVPVRAHGPELIFQDGGIEHRVVLYHIA